MFGRKPFQDIAPAELNRMLSNDSPPVVVDVREPWEYATRHVPGARLIPLNDVPAQYRDLDPRQPTVIICEHGSRSQMAAAFLKRQGFEAVYNVVGGTDAWERAGLTLEGE
ncbi:MAG: rhodanese-like domain-containing protein [Anaerolineae bacterium]